MQLTTEVLQLIQAIGWAAAVIVLLVVVVVMFALILRSLATRATKESGAVTHIALDSTKEAFENSDKLVDVYKQFGDVKQELGRSQGQTVVLMDIIKTNEQKREAFELVMKDKIFALEQADKSKTVLIARHEGRIAELESANERKDEIIAAKEHEIVDLTIKNTQLQSTVASQAIEIDRLNKSVQLVTRAQSLDDTIQFTEADIATLADPVPTVAILPTPETPKPETDESLPKAS